MLEDQFSEVDRGRLAVDYLAIRLFFRAAA